MTPPAPKIAVSLYLHGRELEPEKITALLATSPTHQHSMGKKQTAVSGNVLTRKGGLCAIEPRCNSVSVNDHVESLIEMTDSLRRTLRNKQLSLGNLPGVEDAYLDIFFIQKKDKASQREHRFDLSAVSVQKMAEFGVPITFTIGF